MAKNASAKKGKKTIKIRDLKPTAAKSRAVKGGARRRVFLTGT